MTKKPPAKLQSHLVRSMIKEDVDVSRSVTLNVYGAESVNELALSL